MEFPAVLGVFLMNVSQGRYRITVSASCCQHADKFQQFTYGVVREGVIAENFPRVSAKFPQTFRRISAPFPGAIRRSVRELSAEFPQTFRKNPFVNDPIS